MAPPIKRKTVSIWPFAAPENIRLCIEPALRVCRFVPLYCGFLLFSLPLVAPNATAAVFDLPREGATVVGKNRVIAVNSPSTLLDIARRFDIGYHEITAANPDIDVWTPAIGTRVIVPTQFILPPKPWRGIVINIPQRRLFYFLPQSGATPAQIITYPISIAREGWTTPLGTTQVVAKHKDPGWLVPQSIRAEKAREGHENFPIYFPPGPNNPMGMLAIQTGFSGIYIHGTNKPWGVGLRNSHGCLHLYPEDAAQFYSLIKPGLPVRIIDQPVVAGVVAGQLLMARYPTIAEYQSSADTFVQAVEALKPWLQTGHSAAGRSVDWTQVLLRIDSLGVVPTAIAPDAVAPEKLISEQSAEPYDLPPYDKHANDARVPAALAP